MTGATMLLDNMKSTTTTDGLTDLIFRVNAAATLTTGFVGDGIAADSQLYHVNFLEEIGIVTVFVGNVCGNDW